MVGSFKATVPQRLVHLVWIGFVQLEECENKNWRESAL